jgi:hypothetical protein
MFPATCPSQTIVRMMFEGSRRILAQWVMKASWVTRRERSHAHGFGVALMLEENRQVEVDDLAQNYRWWIAHAESETSKRIHR